MKTMQRHHSTQFGFTLAEVLVASAIFTVIIIAALLIYDRSNQVFKASSESIDLQQNSRVAFNKLVADVRMAGFDYDRDGIPTGVTPTVWKASTTYIVGDIVVPTAGGSNQYFCTQGGQSGTVEPTWPASGTVSEPSNGPVWQQSAGVAVYQQPDEQVEYAGQTAITIRANYDYDANQSGDRFNGRETTLEANSPWFPVITTGNDEIVTYALSKPSLIPSSKSTAGSGCTKTSTNCVHFFADVNSSGSEARVTRPGGSSERAIDIAGLDLTNSAPPYTLYRITLASNGDAVYTPVADNIRSLRFKYYEDMAGTAPLKDLASTPADVSNGVGGDGQYNPADSGAIIADRLIRAKIKSIQVELIGMNPISDKNYKDPNPAWTGTTDTVSPNTRKYTLSTLVVPRNLGKRGQRIQSIDAPQAPKITKVCVGYCGLAQITWSAPSGGGVTSYNILYDTAQNGSFTSLKPQGLVTTGYVDLTPGVPYYFRIQALNDYGSGTSQTYKQPDGLATSYTLNSTTTPNNPGTPVATTNKASEVDVAWTRPTSYASSANTTTCDPGGNEVPPSIPTAEGIGYNIWRSNSTPVSTAGTPYISYTSTAPVTNNVTGEVDLKDTSVSPCVDYYYAIQATKSVCESNASYYTQPIRSGIVTTASAGRATGTGLAPAAPSDISFLNDSTRGAVSACAGGTCSVYLEWPRVTADTSSNPLVVDRYEVSRTQLLNGVATTAASSPNSTIGSNAAYAGTVTFIVGNQSSTTTTNVDPWYTTPAFTPDAVPQTDQTTGKDYSYQYSVRAYQCSAPGSYSPSRMFPCTFLSDGAATPSSLGTANVTIGNKFEGTGTFADPYRFDTPASVVASVSPIGAAPAQYVSSIHLIAYTVNGTSLTNPVDFTPRTGSSPGISGATFSFDTTSFGTMYYFDVAFTDASGCTTHAGTYGMMESSSCCLRQLTDDPAQTNANAIKGVIRGFSAGVSTYVDVFFENICGRNLVIQPNGIALTWSSSGLAGGTKITSVEYPSQGSSGTSTCTFTSGNTPNNCYVYAFASSNRGSGAKTIPTTTGNVNTTPSDIAPYSTSSQTYRVRVTFSNALSTQPITAMSVSYLDSSTPPTTVSCSIVP